MNNSEQIREVVAAAELAAGAGDYRLAERHLRNVVAMQEAAYGPAHPDLANTLNNLGVACERLGKLDDAEAAYRRACAVALQAFPAGDPVVVRSAENLRDFCAARGRPLDPHELAEPAPAPGAASPPHESHKTEAPAVATPTPMVAVAPVRAEPQAVPAPVRTPGPAPAAAHVAPRSADRSTVPFVVVALVVAAVAIWWWMGRSGSESDAMSTTAPATSAAPAESAGSPAVAATEPAETGANEPEAPAPPATSVAGPVEESMPTPAVAEPSEADPPVGASDMVAAAAVCQSFRPTGAEWLCDPVAGTTTPGRALVYYTRVRSPRPMTIEHRWYRGETLVQRVELAIGANSGAGYRTYSRQSAGSGVWRVELRAGGMRLHEARFTVR